MESLCEPMQAKPPFRPEAPQPGLTGLQYAHIEVMPARQFQRGREAGKARADDRDIAGLVAGKWRTGDGQGIGRGLPVAVNRRIEMEGMRMS